MTQTQTSEPATRPESDKELQQGRQARTLVQRLNACMAEPQCRYLRKDAATGIGNVKGVGHDAVAAAVGDAFIKHGVVIIPSVVRHEITELKPDRQGWNKGFLIDMAFRLVNADNAEDFIESSWSGVGPLNDKGLAIAESISTKRFLMKLVLAETGVNDESSFAGNGESETEPIVNDDPRQAVTNDQKRAFAENVNQSRQSRLQNIGCDNAPPFAAWLPNVVKCVTGMTTVRLQGELAEIAGALETGKVNWITGDLADVHPEEPVEPHAEPESQEPAAKGPLF